MKKIRKIILSLILSGAMCAGTVCPAFSASDDVVGYYSFSISNPYETVDWETWKAYKGATHVHTKRSDGDIHPDEMIEKYYSQGFQILALTDHGTVNYSWKKKQSQLAIYYYNSTKPHVLTEERYEQITSGADRGGDGMLEVPLGIELNGMSTSKCHVNSYFADCGHGDLAITATWPEDAIKKSQNAGGICHINHVGEWTDGKDDINTYDESFITKFSNLFLNYSACVGMELVNTTDNRTHNDRYLYDETLKKTAPLGRNIWGFCEDDAHDFGDVENNAQFFLMPDNSVENVRKSMENGTFFACSKNAKTDYELGNGFAAEGEFPMISRVDVNNEKNQISINPYNAHTVKMIADGQIIAEKTVSSDNETITFDLNDYENQINSYVRIFVLGNGGICYAQPFLTTKTESKKCSVNFNIPYDDYSLTVKDSDGNIIEVSNTNKFLITKAGEYFYTIVKENYEILNSSFIISQEAINAQHNVNINIELYKNTGPLSIEKNESLVYGFEILNDITDSVNQSIGLKKGTHILIDNPNKPRTGDKIKIINDETEAIEKIYTVVVFGDVNGDGIYDGQDATVLSMIQGGMINPTNAQKLAADCNHDEKIDDDDIYLLNQAGILISGVTQIEEIKVLSVYDEYTELISQTTEFEPDTSEIEEKPITSSLMIRIILEIVDFFKSIINLIK